MIETPQPEHTNHFENMGAALLHVFMPATAETLHAGGSQDRQKVVAAASFDAIANLALVLPLATRDTPSALFAGALMRLGWDRYGGRIINRIVR